MRHALQTYWLPVAMLAAAVLKIALCAAMPLCIHAGAAYDDAWAVRAGEAIAQGRWLGAYDDIALVKNIGFPLWLAFCIKLGCGYLVPTAALYALASALLSWALRPLASGKVALFALYALVLFCPVSFATDTFQRPYRNSITAAQVLLVFAAYVGAFARVACGRRRVRDVAPWMLLGAVSLAWFWITREDSAWMAPFVLVATAVLAVLLVSGACRGASSALGALLSVALVLLPLPATGLAVQAVRTANGALYGHAVCAELASGNFARMVKCLYAIDPAQLDDVYGPDADGRGQRVAAGGMPASLRVACTHAGVIAACNASPALASIAVQVEAQFAGWGDAIDNDPGDGEVNGGEFAWVLRRAARDAGFYDSAQHAEAFFGRVADELEAAFADGRLPQRATWPSSIMTPWRAEYAGQLPGAVAGVMAQAVAYGDVSAQPYSAQGSEEGIAYFERVLGGERWSEGQPVPFACMAAEGIVWAYRALGPLLAVGGIVCALLVVRAAVCAPRRSRQRRELAATVLVLAALALSVLALAIGLGYSRISSFIPISYCYYGSAAYPLLLVFNALAIAVYARGRHRE